MRCLGFLLPQSLIAIAIFSSLTIQASSSKSGGFSYYLYDWGLLGPVPKQTYKSFQLKAPLLNYAQWSARCDDGLTFIEPRGRMVSKPGPVIVDSRGELVWMEDQYGQAMDFKVQQYKGQDYLTFWTGSDTGTFGSGQYIMLDSSYQVYKTLSPANGLSGDLHEFEITENGTALMTIYAARPADLSAFGVSSQGWIYDSIFQEIDLETGDLLFQWRAADHYRLEDSFHTLEAEARRPVTSDRDGNAIGAEPKSAWDFFHINSIDKDAQGNYYISSRYMHTVTCISPTGEILWILGGKRNQFTDLSLGAATNFSFQHHATLHENNTLTIFDNGKYDSRSDNAEHSRGLVVSLDLDDMTATLLQEYVHPTHVLVGSQGSIQLLPDSGHALVGWGYVPAYTEFDTDGTVLCDVHIAPSIVWGFGWVKSYRTFRSSSWTGRPYSPPTVYLRPRDGVIYVSWNGATEVDRWLLQGHTDVLQSSSGADMFEDLVSIKKETFESSLKITAEMPTYIRLAALDRNGDVLGYSEVLNRRIGNAPSELPRLVISMVFVLTLCAIFCFWTGRRSIPARLKMLKRKSVAAWRCRGRTTLGLQVSKQHLLGQDDEPDEWDEEASEGRHRVDVEDSERAVP